MKHIIPLLLLSLLTPVPAFAEISAECKAALADESRYKTEKKESYRMLVPGKTGWLFRSETDFVQDFTFGGEAVTWLKRFRDALRSRGTELVIAYQPTRGMVGARYLPEDTRFDAEKALESYKQLISTMQKEGLHFVGVPNFEKGEGYFRKMDQHWNVKGARKTAENVSAYIKSLPVYEALPKSAFQTVSKGAYAFEGRFNEVVKAFCGDDLPLEKDEEVVTSQQVSGEADALFAEEPVPEVVLVGTSNSKADLFNANFDGALKEFLQTDVWNAAVPGAGIDSPMYDYLASGLYQGHPPKVLIWELPGYYVMDDYSDIFRQFTALLHGECKGKSLAHFDPAPLQGNEDITLLENVEGKSIANNTSYLRLTFDKPVKKHFSVFFTYPDGSKKRFKFKRSSRAENKTIFAVTLPEDKNDPLDGLTIQVPAKLDGYKVSGEICLMPGL